MLTCLRSLGIALVIGVSSMTAQGQQEPAPVENAEGIQFSQFSDPVDIQALIDYVSRRLQINIIMTDTGLQGNQVVFRAPMTVRDDQLLNLLEMLMEPYGYTLTRERDEGWYVVRPIDGLQLDLGDEFGSTQVFPTPLIRPTAMKSAIEAVMPGDLSRMKIAYVDELGVIISTAPPRLNKSLELVVELLLDGQKGQRLHRFDLQHVAAGEARDRILTLTGQGESASAAQRAPGQQPQAATGSSAISSLSNLGDRLVIDRMGNSLIFRGEEGEIEEASQLVAMVDQPSRLIIRRYNAGAMTPVIASYGQTLGLGPTTSTSAAAAGQQGQRGQDTGAIGSHFEITDPDAQWFTYYGTEAQHDKIEELVDQYADQIRLEQLVVEFYKLEYSDAVETADLLAELLDIDVEQAEQAQSPFLPGGLQGGTSRGVNTQRGISSVQDLETQGFPGASDRIQGAPGQVPGGPAPGEGDISGITPTEGIAIIADEARNQLIIRAPAKQQDEFRTIIEKLDQRRPQVYLDVQIVAVNLTDSFELTIDWALDSNDFPVFTNFGLRGEPFDNTDVPTNFAGITAAIVRSNYIPFIINALATEADARIMSRPRLLVNDNEEAAISSTTDEPFSSTSQVAGAPSQTSLGGTLSAGTTVTVEPHISSGGFLVLDFSVELSAFGERPNPDLPPTRRSDNIESIVTVPSDSTVIVGGFTFEQEMESIQKIPFIGDIPLIGELFKDRTSSTSQRTIYVFMTPRVLTDPRFADLRLLTEGPADISEVDLASPELLPALMPLYGVEFPGDDVDDELTELDGEGEPGETSPEDDANNESGDS